MGKKVKGLESSGKKIKIHTPIFKVFQSRGIASFFNTGSMIGKQRGEIVAEHTALIAKNKAVKRQRVEVSLDDSASLPIDFNEYKGGAI